MTTKRKLIMTTLAKIGPSILDDIVEATKMPRKNLQDNIKACVDEDLIDKFKDDVTFLPAYKVSPKGKKWLANQNSSVTTQAMSGEITIAVADASTSLASAFPGQAATVIEPPKTDDMPSAVRSDESALSKSVTGLCEWIGKRLHTRSPRNLRECRDFIEDRLMCAEADASLIAEQTQQIAKLRAEILAQKTHPVIGYAIIPDNDGMIIHANEASAREEAAHLIVEENDAYSTAHLVAILDTAEMQISWKRAA